MGLLARWRAKREERAKKKRLSKMLSGRGGDSRDLTSLWTPAPMPDIDSTSVELPLPHAAPHDAGAPAWSGEGGDFSGGGATGSWDAGGDTGGGSDAGGGGGSSD